MCVEVHVKTLGDWYSPKTREHPQGKFVKYHVGASPSTDLLEWPQMLENNNDPVFVLTRYFPKTFLMEAARGEFIKISKEMS